MTGRSRVVLEVLLKEMARKPGPALATVLAMTAGTGVFVAIYLAGAAARSSFIDTVEAVAGRATHQVTAITGLPETRFAELAVHPAVLEAQPIVEDFLPVLYLGSAPEEFQAELRAAEEQQERATKNGKRLPPLRILGLDPFFAIPFIGHNSKEPIVKAEDFDAFLTQTGSAIIPARWANETGARVGDTVLCSKSGSIRTLRILGIYELDVLGEAARDAAIVDIATAQELLDFYGKLERIDLILEEAHADEFEKTLLPGERLDRPANRGARVARMIDAFRLNLLALGGLALVVGALSIFNAVQFGVVRRERLLGQLRCLGITRRDILSAVLLETALFGLAGGVLGLAAGYLLAQSLAGQLARTISELYAFVRVELITLDGSFALAVLLGTLLIAAAAAYFPAVDAATTPPRLTGMRSRSETLFHALLPRVLLFGAIFLLSGLLALILPTESWWTGLVASFAFLGTGACLMPLCMRALLPLARYLFEKCEWQTGALAAGALWRSLSRAGGAAAALAVALAMTIGVIAMISSFDREVRNWLNSAIHADLYLAEPKNELGRNASTIPPTALDIVRDTAGVRAIDTLRTVEVVTPDGTATFPFFGVEWPVPESRQRIELLAGDERNAIDRALQGAVLISEPLSRHRKLRVGDRLEINGNAGRVSFEISGIFRDFTYERGFALTGVETFLKHFEDPGIRSAAIYLETYIDRDALAGQLRGRLAQDYLLHLRSNAQLRENVMEVFARTFAVTYLLQTIALIFALAGIAVTLSSLFLERSREIATLRALGGSIRYISGLFASEALLLSSFPILLALPLGALLAWILIEIVNLRSFGWTIGMHWPWQPIFSTCALALLAGLFATIVPWLLARRQSIAHALRDE